MSVPMFTAAMFPSSGTTSGASSSGVTADTTTPAVEGALAEDALPEFAATLDEAIIALAPMEPMPTATPAVPLMPALAPAALAVSDAEASSPPPSGSAPAPAAHPPGWPPPGLSSLFPEALPAPMAASIPTAASAASASTPSAAPPVDHATGAFPIDPLAAALARQPSPLRGSVVDDADGSALAAITEAFAPERLPDGALPATNAATTLPKLDLAQAFPAPIPLPSKHFAEDVGARLQWIAEQQGGEATLRISPEGLGPVEVRLKLDGDRVELGFTASQQDTRQALQDALPKLREMLAQQGLQLGHADVGQQHAKSSNDEARKTAKGLDADESGDPSAVAAPVREATVSVGRVGQGVLDLYA
jgi:flagellar hook-length control protein FliK